MFYKAGYPPLLLRVQVLVLVQVLVWGVLAVEVQACERGPVTQRSSTPSIAAASILEQEHGVRAAAVGETRPAAAVWGERGRSGREDGGGGEVSE